MQSSILAAADADFIQGIRVAIATAMAVLIVVFAAGFVWFPRGKGAIADAQAEEAKLAREESERADL
jgi:uncharacterized membrane protein affecting hemolysin expression